MFLSYNNWIFKTPQNIKYQFRPKPKKNSFPKRPVVRPWGNLKFNKLILYVSNISPQQSCRNLLAFKKTFLKTLFPRKSKSYLKTSTGTSPTLRSKIPISSNAWEVKQISKILVRISNFALFRNNFLKLWDIWRAKGRNLWYFEYFLRNIENYVHKYGLLFRNFHIFIEMSETGIYP